MNTADFQALRGLDTDIRSSLMRQIRDLWTHGSTAIEGNTLTLGETKFVIEEGLTISGKPLRDHQEVVGHARAIDLVYGLLDCPLQLDDLFQLHRAVQTSIVTDIYKPIGAWKREPNGTYAVTEDERQTFIEYARPEDVPVLMTRWLGQLNRFGELPLTEAEAIDAYARLHLGFVHIHPFWDGNGRMARLLGNLPVLRSGHLPVVIEARERKRYIDSLATYQIAMGQLDSASNPMPDPAHETAFLSFCHASYGATRALIEAARERQAARNRHGAHSPP
jgi:Fic family protein